MCGVATGFDANEIQRSGVNEASAAERRTGRDGSHVPRGQVALHISNSTSYGSMYGIPMGSYGGWCTHHQPLSLFVQNLAHGSEYTHKLALSPSRESLYAFSNVSLAQIDSTPECVLDAFL